MRDGRELRSNEWSASSSCRLHPAKFSHYSLATTKVRRSHGGATTKYTYLDRTFCTVQRHQFAASSGRTTGFIEPISSRPVGRAASEIALPHMNASTRWATSSVTTGCTLPPLLYVSSLDDSNMDAFVTQKFTAGLECRPAMPSSSSLRDYLYEGCKIFFSVALRSLGRTGRSEEKITTPLPGNESRTSTP
jgi:hypothetical protein